MSTPHTQQAPAPTTAQATQPGAAPDPAPEPDWEEASRWAEHARFEQAAFIPTHPEGRTGPDPDAGPALLARAGVGCRHWTRPHRAGRHRGPARSGWVKTWTPH